MRKLRSRVIIPGLTYFYGQTHNKNPGLLAPKNGASFQTAAPNVQSWLLKVNLTWGIRRTTLGHI